MKKEEEEKPQQPSQKEEEEKPQQPSQKEEEEKSQQPSDYRTGSDKKKEPVFKEGRIPKSKSEGTIFTSIKIQRDMLN